MSQSASLREPPLETSLETRPLQPFGAEVLGLDLSRPLSPGIVQALKALWLKNFVLVIRNQRLSEEQQIAYTRNFGELAIYIEGDKRSTRNLEIVRIGNVDESGERMTDEKSYIPRYYEVLTGLWHTDGSYKSVPSFASVLHAIEVPPKGGQTCYANMVAAWESLPPALKRRIEGKQMVHNVEFTRYFAEGIPPRTEEMRRAEPPVCHPLVRSHADGRKSLYISANVAYYVGNMPLEEGKALHRELVEWATRPEFVYSHEWQVGDVVMWDNRFLLHKVIPYDRSHRRRMQRTELVGTEIPQ